MAAMNKPTPSVLKWDYDKRPSDYRITGEYIGAEGHHLRRTVGRVTHEADARLIAAAPEMLEALQTVQIDLLCAAQFWMQDEDDQVADYNSKRVLMLHMKIKELITKATTP